jgi:hypothetical protein
MKGWGHKESKLIRLIVRHRYNPELSAVKEEYRKRYNKTLYDRILEENISGEYEQGLLKIVKPF